jgi:hypothetical protein
MDKIETYKGFEIRAFEREQGRWRAEIRKADGSSKSNSQSAFSKACQVFLGIKIEPPFSMGWRASSRMQNPLPSTT